MSQNQDESDDPTEYNLKVIQRWKKDLEHQETAVKARLKFAYNIYRKRAIRSNEPFIRELFEESILTQMSLREIFSDLWGLVDSDIIQYEIKAILDQRISQLEGRILEKLTATTIKSGVQNAIDKWVAKMDKRLKESKAQRANYVT